MKIKPTYEIQNIVAHGYLPVVLDLFKLAQKLEDIEYEPEQFPGAIVKLIKPKVSLLIFKNGKVIVAGAKNEKTIREALRVAFKLVESYSKTKTPKTYTPKYTVVNIVSSGNLGVDLDLFKITTKLPEVEYEPEQFPGAIMRINNPKCSFLLFKNGKIIIAGCKVESEIKRSLKVLVKKIKPFAVEPKKKK